MNTLARRPVRGEVLRLDVPADTAFLSVVRTSCVAATALVLDDYDRLHDLRLAVEELAVVLIMHAAERASLEVRVTIADAGIHVGARVAADPGLLATPGPSEVAAMVLSAIAEAGQVARDGNTLVAGLRLSGGIPA